MNSLPYTAQKMKFSIKDFFSKYDQIQRKLQIWSHILKKSYLSIIQCGYFIALNLFCMKMS